MCFGSSSKPKGQKPLRILQKKNNKWFLKLCLIGNANVGKTSVTFRYKTGQFSPICDPTIAGCYQQKKIQINIWDTAGDQKYRAIMNLYYRDAEVILLVFDLTDPESFQGVDYWMEQLGQTLDAEKLILFIVGNKKDLEQQRRVSRQQGEQKASQRSNCYYHETSAKSGEGITQLFDMIVEEYMKKKKGGK